VVIKSILRCFELASGLRVNFHTNRLGDVGIVKNKLHHFELWIDECSNQLSII